MATTEFIWPPQHQSSFGFNGRGDILLHGLGPISSECFAAFASGDHFHAYGIANNSLLFCDPAADVQPDDLVVVMKDGNLAVKLYCPTKQLPSDSDIPILQSKRDVYAKVIGSFNFYT